MSDFHIFEKFFCWNGCEDALKESIERNEFIKQMRRKLLKKRIKKH